VGTAALALWRARDVRGWRICVAIGGAALAIPLAGKVVGADYLFPRNMIAAWVPLAVALGAAAAWPRIGPLAVGALCAVFLTLTIAVDLDTNLQRADWRAAARAIGPAHEPRALVAPAVGDDPLAYYAGGAKLVRGGVTVRELDVLAFSAAPRPRDRAVPAGFLQVGRQRVGAFTLVRYRSSSARRVRRPQLARARLGAGHAAVVVQRP
jgi:hypothetical protein